MPRLSLSVFGAWRNGRELMTPAGPERRSRLRRQPAAESLESRSCPSAVAPTLGGDRLAHVLVASGHREELVIGAKRDESNIAIPFKKTKLHGGSQTIYVKQGGKVNSTAGKTANKPLGSFARALKLIKPGSTIVLEPGTYTQNLGVMDKSNLTLVLESGTYTARIGVNNSSNITIVGAANQSSILSPSSGDAIDTYTSSNVTIENVWFRSRGSAGRGLADAGSSVTVENIKTDGTLGDGVVVASDQGRTGTLNAISSQFDAVQIGDGLDLQSGSAATINACTFNGVGTSTSATQASNGLVVESGASANITSSQFVGNTNSGLVAIGNAQVTASGCTFSSNQQGDGAIFFGQSTANLTDNSFASNGEVVGPTTGLDGLEFNSNFTGTAMVSGNVFQNNTGDGLFIGGAPSTIQVVDNVFDNNLAGMVLYSDGTSVNAEITGNTFEVPTGAPTDFVGLFALGSGVSATVGGSGSASNAFNGFSDLNSISEAHTGGPQNQDLGCPTVNILANTYEQGGMAIPPSQAITPC